MAKQKIITSGMKIDKQPAPPSFGESMYAITTLVGTKPDFAEITKQQDGNRQFRDSKGTFYETELQKRSKSKDKTIAE